MEYRHELKFLVTDMDLEVLRYRLKVIMKPDSHQKGRAYAIRSLYFDDWSNSCLKENEDGVDNRYKYRLRIYDGSDSVIKLEKKSKICGMTKKVSEGISREDCLSYMAEKWIPFAEDTSGLEKEFRAKMRGEGVHPVSIVEYERTAFIEPRGNVRITFDRNICGSDRVGDFLLKTPLVPLLPKGQHILEVKYDELLPEYIAGCLELGSLQRTAFSKYYYARTYKNF